MLTEFVSLDGVIQAPGGNEDFRHAAWSFGETSDKKRFRLVDSKIVGDGVAILTYQRDR